MPTIAFAWRRRRWPRTRTEMRHAKNWSRWLRYLAWDNEQLALLLAQSRPKVSADLASHISGALASAPDDAYDYRGMCSQNEALREGVALVVRDARTDASLADDAQRIHYHLAEGIRRRL